MSVSPVNSSTAPRTSLSEALSTLTSVAVAAGLDGAAARTEGERLAAAVAEAASGAAADWNGQTRQGDTQDFFDAASRGRRWRASPTALLSQLVLNGSAHAATYAQALAEVCSSATGLGAANSRVVGNASVAAASQLAAVRPVPLSPTQPSPTPSPPAPATPPVSQPLSQPASPDDTPHPLLAVLAQTQQRLAELGRLGLGTTRASQPTGSTFDLPPDAARLPGAFAGLGGFGGLPAPVDPLLPSQTVTTQTVTQSAPTANVEPAPTQATAEPTTPAAVPAVPEEEPRTLDELLGELDALTGLTEVKAEIHRQVQLLRVEKLRVEAGLRSPTITRHLVFVGNPGTGKTTVARLVGGIYRALGLLSTGQLVEVDRSELVAGFLGQTAIKTSEVVASAVGGVLFIDEAYSLAGDQYGTEAVDTLVKEMEDHRNDLVLIVAGYPDPMVQFIGQNPGLASRFRTTIEFADYADEELVDIFTGLAASADYDVTDGCLSRFRSILTTTPRGHSFGNGRFARNHLEAAIGRHAWRLRDVDAPTLSELRELVADDLDAEAPEPSQPGPAQPDPEPQLDPIADLLADATEAPRVRAPDASTPDTSTSDSSLREDRA